MKKFRTVLLLTNSAFQSGDTLKIPTSALATYLILLWHFNDVPPIGDWRNMFNANHRLA